MSGDEDHLFARKMLPPDQKTYVLVTASAPDPLVPVPTICPVQPKHDRSAFMTTVALPGLSVQ